MKDCSRCRHSVENNPAMAGKRWIDTPCANCTLQNPGHDLSRLHDNEFYPIIQGRLEDTIIAGGNGPREPRRYPSGLIVESF